MSLAPHDQTNGDCRRVRIAPVVYAADVIGDEVLAAVLRELPSDDPIRPALAALPRPVPFIS